MEPAMDHIRTPRMVRAAMLVVSATAVIAAAQAAERAVPHDWPQSALRSPAMDAMLRADRNKDGMLSREELEEYDLTLLPRFTEVDWDLNGKLSLYEFEFLLNASQAPSIGATR
jgi:hypothetical protein